MAHPQRVVTRRTARAFTCALLELLDEGFLDKDILIENLLSWMSEADVEQFCRKNLRDEDNESIIRFDTEVKGEED